MTVHSLIHGQVTIDQQMEYSRDEGIVCILIHVYYFNDLYTLYINLNKEKDRSASHRLLLR